MGSVVTLKTDRLLLRGWREADVDPFAAMNADPRVMEFFPSVLTRSETEDAVARAHAHFAQHGFGFWALEVPGVSDFIGFVGLAVPRFEAPFTPCVEIGWRLAAAHWGLGYATEAARAALNFGFEILKLPEIVAFTVPANHKSRSVMHRLGMKRDEHGDFDHPRVPEGHPLRRHVLYRLNSRD